ncbi:MAG: AraC family transcriptional regulator [Dehalococcoidia bacterium]
MTTIDVLSDVLGVIKLDTAIYLNAEFSEPWAFAHPDSTHLAPVLAPGSEQVMIYHLLVDGRAYVQLDGGQRVALSPGDIVTFPHGNPHVFGSGDSVAPQDAAAALPGVLANGLQLIQGGGGGPSSRFICGYLACDTQISHAFLNGLPPVVKVNIRDEEGQWLESSLRFSVQEASTGATGSRAMLTRLAEAVFAETLRRYIHSLPEGETGWLAGTRDPEVGRALGLLHQRPAEPWTIASLAHEVGLSRTVLVERFRYFLDESPMAYLTSWRLRLAARTLRANPSSSLTTTAAAVGYESDAAFSRAFKREFGVPPAQYRRDARAS